MFKRFNFAYRRFLTRFSLLLVLASLALLDLSALGGEFSAAAIPVLRQAPSAHDQAELQETNIQTGASSAAYEFTVVAKTGQAGLTGFGSGAGEEFVSINDAGTVAFIGRSSNNVQAVYVGDGSADPELISLAPDSIRTYGPGLTIDNLGQVTVIDKAIYAGVYRTQLRRWIPGAGEAVPLVKGKATIDEIECPIAFPTVCPYQYSNLYGYVTANNLDQIAFMALELRNPDRRFLVSFAPIKEYPYTPVSAPLPAFADDGYLVFRNDKNSSQSIVRMKADFSNSSTIASAPNFVNLGKSPGVSDDGRVIVFYGELTQTGASALNTAQANLTYSTGGKLKQVKLCPGLGIFASVAIGAGTDTRRAIRRVAGMAGNGCVDPGEDYLDANNNKQFDVGETEIGKFDGFEPDMRVGVNGATRDVGIDTVIYLAKSNSKTGIYANDLSFSHASANVANHAVQPNELTVYAPSLVAETGQSIPELSGQVQKFQLYDPINVAGQIAFWVSTGGQSGMVVAKLPIAVTGIEVTQAIQDLKNSVPLVKDKPTYVRVHVYRYCSDPANCSSLSKVVGRLQLQNVDSSGTLFGPVRILSNRNKPQGITIKLKGQPDRAKLDDSFLFEVPKSWLHDTVEFKYSAAQCEEPQNTYKLANGTELTDDAGNCKVVLNFEQVPTLPIKFVNIPISGQRETSKEAGLKAIPAIVDDVTEILPIPNLLHEVATSSFTHEQFHTTPLDLTLVNGRLKLLKLIEGCFALTGCDTLYVGVIVDPDPGLGQLGKGQATVFGLYDDVASGYVSIRNSNYYVFAHEIAHLLGRKHVLSTKECKGGGGEEEGAGHYPYPEGWIADDNPKSFFGFNSSSRRIIGPKTAGDLMTYCLNRWISDYTYEAAMKIIQERFSTARAAVLQSSTEGILVTGIISTAADTIDALSIYQLTVPTPIPTSNTGAYQIQLQDAQGNELGVYGFDSVQLGDQVSFLPFAVLLPSNPSVARIVMLHGQQVLGSRSKSPNPPSVTLTVPNGGEVIGGSNTMLKWTASDHDGDTLTFVVQYSSDSGTTWQTLAVDWTESIYEINPDSIPGSDQSLIRVLASDGFHTAQDQSDAVFSVTRKAPTAFITGPADNDYYVPGQWINLDGDAFDYEDEDLADSAFVWRSDVDGELGSGRSLAVSTGALSDGVHTITLRVTDSNGQVGEASIHIALYQQAPIFPAALGALPATLEFFGVVGGIELLVDSLPIYNSGDGELTWNATDNQSWIQLDATSGSAPHDLAVTVNPSGLAVGTYTGTVHINSLAANSPQTVTVTLVIAPNDPGNTSALQVDSSTMNFTAKQGENNPAAQSLTLNHTGSTSLTWTATLSPTWLHLSQTSGATPATLDVSVDIAGLAAGTHQGEIRIMSEGQANPLIVPVTLVLNPAGGNSLLQVDSTALNYNALVGNGNPTPQVLAITTSGTPAWSAIVSGSWIKLSASEGTGSSNLQVSVDTTGLALGTHSGQITILSDVLSEPIIVNVQLTLVKAVLQINPQAFTFSAIVGNNPIAQKFSIQSNAIISWTVSETIPWLSVTPITGSVPSTVTVTVESASLAASSYDGHIIVNGTGAEQQSINVTLDVNEDISSREQKVYLPVVTR